MSLMGEENPTCRVECTIKEALFVKAAFIIVGQ